MQWETLTGTWRGIKWENGFHRVVVVVLLLTNGGTLAALLSTEETVVLVPPVLDGEVTLARDRASQSVREAWALYLAELLGNVSARSSDFIADAVDPLLAPTLRATVTDVIAAQVAEIQRERVNMYFAPDTLYHDPETDRFFVSGIQVSRGPAGASVSHERTFEIGVAFRNYRPVITHLNAYEGKPKDATAGGAS